MLTEQRVLHSVNVNIEWSSLEVKWVDRIYRDGALISEKPHRRAYSEFEKSAFLADVPDGGEYVSLVGW